ncbi:oligosaccharide flippase family protein [Escherichia coli]
MKLNPIITRVLFPAFAKIQDDTEKLRVNFYKLLSVVGIINFPALLGLTLASTSLYRWAPVRSGTALFRVAIAVCGGAAVFRG